ncbi:acetoacetate decarboxylase [Haematobacter missouriensis]|uniref:Acetoacetate decarboxylase n=1 Tax=Haematobacter missouriensis TaxID=366616 RepID=A0A212AKS6_9RHOB|nr:acetoacetate decarboxylase family protein [Haematobacter missouriensis]KFI24437.1 acetoacetate decarboxylase [Haematobacter missouriensis]OWJ73595.1 acetoacetate decarboxylase [Haematobacter missouriensis]OWJ82003.1 acetoacetate decarboxylase [Haematobacter missouriensis]
MTQETVEVEFAGYKVEVPAGGYYDRFRSNPDLEEVARDPAAGNIDFFRRIPKVQLQTRLGPAWSPNFYYRASTLQLLFLSPLTKLAALLPPPLQPLHALPGYGLVALTYFSYRVCDNDPYNEVSIAVLLRRPGSRQFGPLELLQSIRRRTYHAHVLALPVDTEIARLRGVMGYQLPKWLAKIDLNLDGAISASIQSPDGSTDLSVRAPLPRLRKVPSQAQIGTNISVGLLDGAWHQTLVQSNPTEFAEVSMPKDVTILRGGGTMSRLLDGLGAGRIMRMDVVRDTQMVLHLPRPISIPDRG